MKSKLKRWIAVLLALSLMVMVAACGAQSGGDTPADGSVVADGGADASTADAGGNADAGETIKIAAFFNASGASADYGVIDFRACEFAVEWVNEHGGIKSMNGAKLELVTADVMSDPTQAKAVVERTLAAHNISAAVGSSTSSTTIPMLPVFEKAQIPMVTSNYSPDIVNQGYTYILMPCAQGPQHAETQAAFLKYMNDEHAAGITSAGIIYEDSDVGKSTMASAEPIVAAAGVEVVFNESFPPGLSDASAIVTKLKNSGAGVVFVNAQTLDLKLLLSAMKSLDYSPVVFGSAGGVLLEQFANDLGDDCLGIIASGACAVDSKQNMENPDTVAYFDAYRERYDVVYIDEHITQISNLIFTVAAALEQCASTEGTVIRDALLALDYQSFIPGGPYAFDETGWNTNAVPALVQWQKREDGGYSCNMIYPDEWAVKEYIPIGQE